MDSAREHLFDGPHDRRTYCSHDPAGFAGIVQVLLKAPLSPYSGWGQDGIGLALAMTSLGIKIRVQPLEVVPPLPAGIAQLLTVPLEPPFDLLIAHVAADRSGLSPVEQAASRKRILWS